MSWAMRAKSSDEVSYGRRCQYSMIAKAEQFVGKRRMRAASKCEDVAGLGVKQVEFGKERFDEVLRMPLSESFRKVGAKAHVALA